MKNIIIYSNFLLLAFFSIILADYDIRLPCELELNYEYFDFRRCSQLTLNNAKSFNKLDGVYTELYNETMEQNYLPIKVMSFKEEKNFAKIEISEGLKLVRYPSSGIIKPGTSLEFAVRTTLIPYYNTSKVRIIIRSGEWINFQITDNTNLLVHTQVKNMKFKKVMNKYVVEIDGESEHSSTNFESNNNTSLFTSSYYNNGDKDTVHHIVKKRGLTQKTRYQFTFVSNINLWFKHHKCDDDPNFDKNCWTQDMATTLKNYHKAIEQSKTDLIIYNGGITNYGFYEQWVYFFEKFYNRHSRISMFGLGESDILNGYENCWNKYDTSLTGCSVNSTKYLINDIIKWDQTLRNSWYDVVNENKNENSYKGSFSRGFDIGDSSFHFIQMNLSPEFNGEFIDYGSLNKFTWTGINSKKFIRQIQQARRRYKILVFNFNGNIPSSFYKFLLDNDVELRLVVVINSPKTTRPQRNNLNVNIVEYNNAYFTNHYISNIFFEGKCITFQTHDVLNNNINFVETKCFGDTSS